MIAPPSRALAKPGSNNGGLCRIETRPRRWREEFPSRDGRAPKKRRTPQRRRLFSKVCGNVRRLIFTTIFGPIAPNKSCKLGSMSVCRHFTGHLIDFDAARGLAAHGTKPLETFTRPDLNADCLRAVAQRGTLIDKTTESGGKH